MRRHTVILAMMVNSAFAGQDIPVTIQVFSSNGQCAIFGKSIPCVQVVKLLKKAEVPFDHAVGVYADGQEDPSRTKPVVDLIRAAGYTNVSQGYFQKGASD